MRPQVRPKHLALLKIRLPLPGIVSFLHRVSGALLFLGLPALLWLLDSTLHNPTVFAKCQHCMASMLFKLGFLALLWAYMHHFCAGIRFLFLDVHKGLDLATARMTAQIVLGVSLILTVMIGVWLW